MMCNETGIPELPGFQIPGIPMVVMVTSHVRSLRDRTQQDFVNERTLPIYKCHSDSNSEEPSSIHYAK